MDKVEGTMNGHLFWAAREAGMSGGRRLEVRSRGLENLGRPLFLYGPCSLGAQSYSIIAMLESKTPSGRYCSESPLNDC